MARLIAALMDIVFLIGVVWTLSRSLRNFWGSTRRGFRGGVKSDSSRQAPPVEGRTARDPVCGMFVSTEVSLRLARGGETFHFCSKDCLEKFQKKAAGA